MRGQKPCRQGAVGPWERRPRNARRPTIVHLLRPVLQGGNCVLPAATCRLLAHCSAAATAGGRAGGRMNINVVSMLMWRAGEGGGGGLQEAGL